MDRRVVFRLSPDDISAIRFGVSPGHELCHAVRAVLDPSSHPLQWSWLRAARPRIPTEPFALLADVIGPQSYMPDFLTSTPSWDMTAADEVDRLRDVSPDQVAFDLGKVVVRSSGARRERVAALQARPEDARARIAEAWQAVWDVVLAPHWPQLERLLRADVGVRVRRMGNAGIAAMVMTLHETVTWTGDAIEVRLRHHDEVVDCAGSGLVMVPSVMATRRGCMVLTERGVQPTLFYPAQGVTEGWHEEGTARTDALEHLLGRSRARVLLALRDELSTSETAEHCGLSLATASHHLAVLTAARLVEKRRDGARVLHSRSPLGDALAGS